MYINTVQEILNKLNSCIVRNTPFNLTRFGDGGLKLVRAFLTQKQKGLDLISEKEGLPKEKIHHILKLWVKYANQADFIDSPEVYFNGFFWPRIKKTNREPISQGTYQLLAGWKRIYKSIGITNTNYCNPEFNYLCMVKRDNETSTLIDIIKDAKIAYITACPRAVKFLKTKKLNIDLIHIVGQFQNHYEESFHHVIKEIQKKATSYDVWLVSAGELGRIYSGVIKEMGGRCVDMGFMAQMWSGHQLHPRLQRYLKVSPEDRLYLEFQMEGKNYAKYI